MIITVSNNKGGVGKTALAAHLIFRAAENVKVLAVDMDSQSNLTGTLIDRQERRGHASADQLFSDIELPIPMETRNPNIDLLPAAPALSSTDRLNLSAAFQAMTHLKTFAKHYPLIVIDTAPALGLRMTAALACAHQVVVPLVPESYSVDGVATVLSEIASIGENLNPGMRPADFVLNLMNPQAKQHRQIAERIAQNFQVAKPWLNRSVAVADALAERRPVWRNTTSKKAGEQWRTLCELLLWKYGVIEMVESDTID